MEPKCNQNRYHKADLILVRFLMILQSIVKEKAEEGRHYFFSTKTDAR